MLIVEDEHLLAMDLDDTLKTHGSRIIGPYVTWTPHTAERNAIIST